MMKTRAISAAIASVALFGVVTCGGDPEPSADAADSSIAADTAAPPVDTHVEPEGTRCCPLGNCPVKESCIQGACLPKLGGGECYLDGQCAPGQRCVGATRCECGELDCEAQPGSCAFPEGCCNGDAECGSGEVCFEGVCRASAGGCWRSDQCKAGESCEGVTSCPCGELSCQAAPGTCGLPGVCCLGDAECGADGVCRGGRCVSAPEGGACFGDGDCEGGQTCEGDYLCACEGGGACLVPTTPGRCGDGAGPCCVDGGDCGAGELCVEGRACLPAPTGDRCWVDAHCGLGRVCEGATVCDCDAGEGCEAQLGECKTQVIDCGADADCPTAMRCVRPDSEICPGAPAPERGVCVEAVDEGCWSAADCAPYRRCAAETICTEAGGCDEPNVAGLCRDKVLMRDCCADHNDCEPGTECRNANASTTCPPDISSVCLSSPVWGESCWATTDCPDGFVCNRAWICGCNGKCYRNHEGACEIPRYCQSDIDCGTDDVCAKDPECIASPCTTQSTCNPGGLCQQRIEGRCWNHNECGAGEYCAGLRICPVDKECVYPDAPGECAPRGDLGECCTSYRGCEPGLRCVSVAAKTGCLLDITAVCVPAITMGLDCYVDEDCGSGQHCAGASICPCGVESCTSAPQVGICVVDS